LKEYHKQDIFVEILYDGHTQAQTSLLVVEETALFDCILSYHLEHYSAVRLKIRVVDNRAARKPVSDEVSGGKRRCFIRSE
jgi:hypothetical protein